MIMEDRLKEIRNLIDKLNIDTEEQKDTNDIVINMILKKYKVLENYNYVYENKIRTGDIIKYVNIDLKKISICGLVVDIIYNDKYNKKVISHMLLYNKYKKIIWSIAPKKYYIFKSKKLGIYNKNNQFIRQQIDAYKNKL
jgi:hypothetical protein